MITTRLTSRIDGDEVTITVVADTTPVAIARASGHRDVGPWLMEQAMDAIVLTALGLVEADDQEWSSYQAQVRWNRLTGCRRGSVAGITAYAASLA